MPKKEYIVIGRNNNLDEFICQDKGRFEKTLKGITHLEGYPIMKESDIIDKIKNGIATFQTYNSINKTFTDVNIQKRGLCEKIKTDF